MTDNDSTIIGNENRFRVFKVNDMYGVSDDIAQYTVAYDKSKLIMDNLCDLLNELNNENQQLKHQRQEWLNEIAIIAMKHKAELKEQ